MPDVLIHGDTIRSPELRHEVPVAIPDPIMYAERGGERHVLVGSFEIPRIQELQSDLVPHAPEEYGVDELLRSGKKIHEIRREALVVEGEPLGAWVELDPARAGVEAADGLLHRPLVDVEPDEGDEAAAGALGVRERALVRRPEARVPVGLVHAEHAGPVDAVALEDPAQLLEGARHAVDVVAQVVVGVDHERVGGQGAAQLVRVQREQLVRACERVVHARECTERACHPDVPVSPPHLPHPRACNSEQRTRGRAGRGDRQPLG